MKRDATELASRATDERVAVADFDNDGRWICSWQRNSGAVLLHKPETTKNIGRNFCSRDNRTFAVGAQGE